MKTFQEFIVENANRSSYDGPGKGESMGRLSTDQHLACMNYHADQEKAVKNGTAKHSNTYDAAEKAKQMTQHRKMYLDHQEAIQALADAHKSNTNR